MGYTIHDAVIASLSHDRSDAPAIRERFLAWSSGLTSSSPAVTDGQVRALAVGPIPWIANAGATYVLACDGSKEGWPESEIGDRLRAEFVEIFTAGDGVDVVSLRFGADYRHDGNDLPSARYEPAPQPPLFDLVRLIVDAGRTDGAHHKQYALDQILRAITGDRYGQIRADLGEWDEGIA